LGSLALASDETVKTHIVICFSSRAVTDNDHFNGDDDEDDDNNNNLPKSVETSQGRKVTLLWNQQVQTDRTIPNNKPDIVIHDNEKGTCMLIDVAISGDRNVTQKEAKKI
jgi:hypothetical protein